MDNKNNIKKENKMEKILNPLENECLLLSMNGWIFVEEIASASSISGESNLAYGQIISEEIHEDWIDSMCDSNVTILFRKTDSNFEFMSQSDGMIHVCYAIKPEDIMGRFESFKND